MGMIVVFISGVIAATVCSEYFGSMAKFFVEIPLFIAFADLLTADLTKEKDMLGKVPHGH